MDHEPPPGSLKGYPLSSSEREPPRPRKPDAPPGSMKHCRLLSEEEAPQPEEPRRKLTPRWTERTSSANSLPAWIGVVALLLVLFCYGAYEAIAFYQLTPFLGVAYFVAISVVLGVLVYFVTQWWIAYSKLQEIEMLQNQARGVRKKLHMRDRSCDELIEQYKQYIVRLRQARRHVPADLDDGIERFQSRIDGDNNPERAVENLEIHVLAPIDLEVDDIIKQRAFEVAIATTLATGFLDAAVVFSQSVRMIGEIANRYGSRPGWFGTARLLRRGLWLALFAVAAEHITDLVTDLVSTSTVARGKGRFAQGIANGLFILRLGEAIRQQCRPIRLEGRRLSTKDFASKCFNALWKPRSPVTRSAAAT